ncbi:glycosyltransferase family 2 protein [Pedobacter agri]|uniref:glycosyltransferase family 2 protein n=1 Tax=Pedobacter agri TaxID=454586 RepID=UPI0027D8F5C6|nr:glycosyltransferase family 2 protein [Pedobacter agri]
MSNKVSVCIATYNGEKFIAEQIRSILVQLDLNDEIVISDDNSEDNTLSIIKDIGDIRIRLFSNEGKGGPIYNFENALLRATGDYIFLSDQDDIWMPDKVDKMLLELKTGRDLVISDCKIVNENLNVLHDSYFKFNNSASGFLKNIHKNSYMGCCMAFNREVLKVCIPFPEDIPMHDSYIGLMAELKFKIKFLQIPLILHRKHNDNSSDTASGKSKYNFKKKILFRFQLLSAIAQKYLKM